MGRELFGFAAPIVQDGGGTNDQGRAVLLPAGMEHPIQPGQGLERFTQTHVVGEDAAEPDFRQVAKEIKPVLLIRTELRLHGCGQLKRRHALEILQPVPQLFGLRRITEHGERLVIEVGGLAHRDFLRDRHQAVDAHVGHHLVRLLDRA